MMLSDDSLLVLLLISAEVITRVIGRMANVTAWVSNAEESGSTEGSGRKGLKVRFKETKGPFK